MNLWFASFTFMADETSFDLTPVIVNSLDKITIENAIYDEFDISLDVSSSYNTDRDTWGYYTVMLAKFQNSLVCGNVDFASDTVSKLRIKRRKIENLTDWWTIAELNFSPTLQFEIYDYVNESEQEYEYCLIPVSSDGSEGAYMTSTVFSQFDDVYITDGESIYKFRYDLNYDNIERVQKKGVFEPLESTYPITVKNAMTNYEKGSLSALVLSESTENNYGVINKKQEVLHRKKLLDFLTSGKSLFLKDGNGASWLIDITGNPSVTFRNELGQQIADISTSEWVEVGSSQSRDDMYYNGLLTSMD